MRLCQTIWWMSLIISRFCFSPLLGYSVKEAQLSVLGHKTRHKPKQSSRLVEQLPQWKRRLYLHYLGLFLAGAFALPPPRVAGNNLFLLLSSTSSSSRMFNNKPRLLIKWVSLGRRVISRLFKAPQVISIDAAQSAARVSLASSSWQLKSYREAPTILSMCLCSTSQSRSHSSSGTENHHSKAQWWLISTWSPFILLFFVLVVH